MKIFKHILVIVAIACVGCGAYVAYMVWTDTCDKINSKAENIAPRREMSFNIKNVTNNDELIAAFDNKFNGITFLIFTSEMCHACLKYQELLSKAPKTFANNPVRIIYVYIDSIPASHRKNEILIDSSELLAQIRSTPTTYVILGNDRLLHVLTGYPQCTPNNIYGEIINFGL